MRKQLIRVVVLVICILSAFISLSPLGTAALAAPRSQDPLVIIAKDTTASSHCQVTYKLNLGTPHMKVIQTSCGAGSDITTYEVPLSVALANHWAYIMLPSTQASADVRVQTLMQIRGLVQATRQAAVLASKVQPVVPTARCGSSNEQDSSWRSSHNSSLTLKSKIFWYKYTYCTDVFIGTAEEGMFSCSNCVITWGYFDYDYKYYYTSCYYLPGAFGKYINSYPNIKGDTGDNPEYINYYNSYNCGNGYEAHQTPALT